MSSAPSVFRVAVYTGSPISFCRGSDSPVIVASFTAELPATTRPSAGILSPGRMRTRSPGRSSATGTVSTESSGRSRSACSGASSTSRAMDRRPRSTAKRSNSSASENRNASVAASKGSPIKMAPMIAADMRKFMSSLRVRTARRPAPAKFHPPTSEAAM